MESLSKCDATAWESAKCALTASQLTEVEETAIITVGAKETEPGGPGDARE